MEIMKRQTKRIIHILPLLLCFMAVIPVPFASAKAYSFSWSANSGEVDGYRLYYKKRGIASTPFNGDDAIEGSSPIDVGDATTFTITGLEDNTTYHFTLTAYSGDEESDFTDVITVFPSDYENRLRTVLMISNLLLLESDSL